MIFSFLLFTICTVYKMMVFITFLNLSILHLDHLPFPQTLCSSHSERHLAPRPTPWILSYSLDFLRAASPCLSSLPALSLHLSMANNLLMVQETRQGLSFLRNLSDSPVWREKCQDLGLPPSWCSHPLILGHQTHSVLCQGLRRSYQG